MKRLQHIIVIITLLLGLNHQATAQQKVVQFSGFVMTADSLTAVPYANISVLGRGLAATARGDGYFSFAAEEGDTLFFTCVGYSPAMYVIPSSLPTEKFSMIQLMSKTEYYLKETIIYPWGSREAFKQAFLDLRPPRDAEDLARQNLERERLAVLAREMEIDGMEASRRSLTEQAARYSYYGQRPPMNIFNPLAWAEFVKAWKRGDFKKKD